MEKRVKKQTQKGKKTLKNICRVMNMEGIYQQKYVWNVRDKDDVF